MSDEAFKTYIAGSTSDMAVRIIAQAKAECDRILEDARLEVMKFDEQILSKSEHDAKTLMNRGRLESEKRLSTSREQMKKDLENACLEIMNELLDTIIEEVLEELIASDAAMTELRTYLKAFALKEKDAVIEPHPDGGWVLTTETWRIDASKSALKADFDRQGRFALYQVLFAPLKEEL